MSPERGSGPSTAREEAMGPLQFRCIVRRNVSTVNVNNHDNFSSSWIADSFNVNTYDISLLRQCHFKSDQGLDG